MKKNAGFTLIELVAVMVILAILAVVAVPQFVDMRTEARQAATDGVAGALSSASALNYAVEMADSTKGKAVGDCDEVGALLQGGMTPGYTITSAPVAEGVQVTCTVVNDDDATVDAKFVAIGVVVP